MTQTIETRGHGFGTAPVFLAAICTILGAILFLRFGYAVAHVGFLGALGIIAIGHMITLPTALAVAEIATNLKVEGGGEYFIISRSFGTTIGAAIGISLYFSQAISVAFYMIAFGEACRGALPWLESTLGMPADIRMVTVPATVALLVLMLTKGADLGVRTLYVVATVLAVALGMFFLGEPLDRGFDGIDLTRTVENAHPFALVFAIVFPAFTGMTAGVGLSGDLKNPRKSIPLGTVLATLTGMLVYALVALKLHLSASPSDLAADQMIMARIAVWDPIVPIGLGAAALSSAVGSILVAPRTLQALGVDRVFPGGNSFLSRGRGDANEPVNATLVTSVVIFVFVGLGDVDFVAQLISMFFMVTYGTLCGISFLEHFASNPSYRPSFRSKWFLSLAGSLMCFVMMFQMSVAYAFSALATMGLIYLGVRQTHKDARGLAAVFQGVTFQLTRWLQIFIQRKHASSRVNDWRPSFIALSRHTLDRLAPFELLKWFCYQHGFGTFIHYVEGYLSVEKVTDSRRILSQMISRTEASGAGVFADTMVSPSFTTALAQSIQMPGVSGLENNSLLLEFSANHPDEADEVVKGCLLAGSLGYHTCVLRSTERAFGYKQNLHVWLTRYDDENTNLMILLAYIILGHPDWQDAEITIFVTFPEGELGDQVSELETLISEGRLPISMRNVRAVPSPENIPRADLVRTHSADADLLLLGFSPEALERVGADALLQFDLPNDILFVHAQEEIRIS